MKIDAQTKLVGIIGYPLNYTLSPVLHNVAFDYLGLNWCYLSLPVKEENFGNTIPGLRALSFVGVNVTIPYKERVIPFVDELNLEAQRVQAVNTLHFRDSKTIGYNTDGPGFLASLREAGFDPKGKRGLMVGAGGVGRAVAFSLAQTGLAYLAILNRTSHRAEALKKSLEKIFPHIKVDVLSFRADLSSVFPEVSFVINATPVGMDPRREELPLSVAGLTDRHFVYDLIYYPLQTPLLKEAQKKGAKILNGLRMLLHQGAASFKIWTGVNPPVEVMAQALQKAVRPGSEV